MTNIGNRKGASDCQPRKKCPVHGSSARAGIKDFGFSVYIRKKMTGIKAAPSTLSQNAELRRVLINSVLAAIRKVIGHYL
jgi:hypothetical protein